MLNAITSPAEETVSGNSGFHSFPHIRVHWQRGRALRITSLSLISSYIDRGERTASGAFERTTCNDDDGDGGGDDEGSYH